MSWLQFEACHKPFVFEDQPWAWRCKKPNHGLAGEDTHHWRLLCHVRTLTKRDWAHRQQIGQGYDRSEGFAPPELGYGISRRMERLCDIINTALLSGLPIQSQLDFLLTMAPISRKRRRPAQHDAETASLLNHDPVSQPSPKKRKISHHRAKTTAVEEIHVDPPCPRTRITLRVRQGRCEQLETGRAGRSASDLQGTRCGSLDQDDTAMKEAIRQDWLRRLRPRPTRAVGGVAVQGLDQAAKLGISI